MPRLIRIAVLTLLVLSLAACQSETTQTASTDPGTVPPVTESMPPADAPQAATTPYVEPLPGEVPSILRREQTTSAAQTDTNVVTDEWPPRVTLSDAKAMMDQGKAVLVDVRAPQYFQERHIRGSLNIPLAEVVLRANEIPKGKTPIAVCT